MKLSWWRDPTERGLVNFKILLVPLIMGKVADVRRWGNVLSMVIREPMSKRSNADEMFSWEYGTLGSWERWMVIKEEICKSKAGGDRDCLDADGSAGNNLLT